MADPELLKKVPLTCVVMAKTKIDLEEYAETTEMPVGDIIDHLVVKLNSTNPIVAAQLILETASVAIAPLDDDGAFETVVRVALDFTALASKVDNYQERLSMVLKKIKETGPDPTWPIE